MPANTVGPAPENPWMQAAAPGYMGMDPLDLRGIWKGPQAPGMPDYYGAAERTAQGNLWGAQQATLANRASQYNPFGSSVWNQGPGGQWSQQTSFSPQMQAMFDASQRGKMDLMGQDMPEFGANRQSVIDAMMSRSDEDIGRRRTTKESQLAAQGIPRGSEAFGKEMDRFDRQTVDARQQAEISATGMAGQEYGAQLAGRGQQMGMYNMFSPQMPQFSQFYQQQATPGADYMGAAMATGQFDMAKYNAAVAANTAKMQGLFSLGGKAMSAFGGGGMG